MEKNRSSKILAIIALLVSAIGLSVGFAAFSQTLTIRSSATVKPNESDFKVVFSSSGTVVETNPVIAVATPSTLNEKTNPGSIVNAGDPKITGLGAEFSAPGQKVEYTFYAANIGEYNAFLRNITFENSGKGSSHRVCTAKEGTTNSLVQEACSSIILTVKVGEGLATNSSITGITGHSLNKGAFEPVVVTIEYAADGARADGDFSVDFGNIILDYSSAN